MSSPRPLRLAGLCALLLAAGPARAADFDRPYPPPGPGYGAPPSPGYGEDDAPERRPLPPRPEFGHPRFTAGPGPCREFVRRRFDPDGEPVLRRVRVCDEPAFERGPPPPPPPPPEEIPPRRWDGPRW